MEATQKFVFRTQSNRAYTYGVGEVVVPGVTLFRTGEYDLLRDEAEALLTRKLKSIS
jgi:hypothetical protein